MPLSTEPPEPETEAALRGEFSKQSEAIIGWPEGYGRVIVPEAGSTLDAARGASQVPPFWYLAMRQTAARGRRGRPWIMPEGNFAATLVLAPPEPPSTLALRSFVMSLALFRALAEVTGTEASLALKWPNDVLLCGCKVAGILLESDGAGKLCVGVGVNLAAAPAPDEVEPGAVRPVSVVEATGVRVGPVDFLTVLARRYAAEEARFQDEGFVPVRGDWTARAAMLDREITARLPQMERRGRFVGIDTDGSLLLQTDSGTDRIAAADIYF